MSFKHLKTLQVVLHLIFLSVFAFDNAFGQQGCSISVSPPYFNKVSVSEAAELGHVVDSINIEGISESFTVTPPVDSSTLFNFIMNDELTMFSITTNKSLVDFNGQLIQYKLDFKCRSNESFGYNDVNYDINIIDANNKRPIFRESSYELNLSYPWPLDVPINILVPIIVTDEDIDPIFRETIFKTNDSKIRAESYLDPATNNTQAILYLTDPAPGLSFTSFLLTAENVNDSNMSSVVLVNVKSKSSNIYPPQFSEISYESTITSLPTEGDTLRFEPDIIVEDPENNQFTFSVDSTLLRVEDSQNGRPSLFFNRIPDEIEIKNGFVIVKLTASETSEENRESSVLLILLFNLEEITTTSVSNPDTSTVTSVTCPEVTTLTSVTCPDVTCPEITTSFTCPETTCPEVTTLTPVTCPDVTCPEVTSFTCPETTCPNSSTTDASTGTTCLEVTCPDITTEKSTGVTCPDVTCPTSPTEPSCPPCPCSSTTISPTTKDPTSPSISTDGSSTDGDIKTTENCDCSCGTESTSLSPPLDDCTNSNVGLIAGIIVTSILFIAAASIAIYYRIELKKVGPGRKILKKLSLVDKWQPDSATFKKQSNPQLLTPSIKPIPFVSIPPVQKLNMGDFEKDKNPQLNATQAKNPLIEEPVIPEPDYRTKPDYSVKIQDAVEIIPPQEEISENLEENNNSQNDEENRLNNEEGQSSTNASDNESMNSVSIENEKL